MATKKIATIKSGKDGTPYIDFDKGNLRELIKYLSAYGAKNLTGMDTPEIWEKDKKRELPSLTASCYKPKDGAPDFILHDVVIKIAD